MDEPGHTNGPPWHYFEQGLLWDTEGRVLMALDVKAVHARFGEGHAGENLIDLFRSKGTSLVPEFRMLPEMKKP